VWSVVSCHMLARLRVPRPASISHESMYTVLLNSVYIKSLPFAVDENVAVHRVLFLDKRVHLSKTTATLVASGPLGVWHVGH
jgi:hypothetical protein